MIHWLQTRVSLSRYWMQSNSITIPLSSRVHSDVAFQKSSSEIIKLKAILEDDRYISINIGLNEQATPGFDAAFDGYHMSFTGIADMYSYHEGDRLSTNYIPYPDDLLSLPMSFTRIKTGTMS